MSSEFEVRSSKFDAGPPDEYRFLEPNTGFDINFALRTSHSELPLHGVRILDMTLVVGPPYGTMLLADMGAEVIRVESRQNWQGSTRGIMARPPKHLVMTGSGMFAGYPDYDPGERPWNRYAMFNSHARSKRSMTADLTRPEGRETFLQLVRMSDGLIENNPAGTLEKLGIGYAVLRAARPDFILVSITGMGQTGPYRHFRGYGAQLEAVMGHTGLRNYLDGTPSTVAVPSDAAAGVGGAAGFMLALHHREQTGEGQLVDLSMAENFMPFLGEAFLDAAMNGRVRQGTGNRSECAAPQGVYLCRPDEGVADDCWLAISVDSDAAWQRLCRAIARPDLAADPALKTVLGRQRQHDRLDEILSDWTRQYSQREAQHLLQAAGIAAGAVLDEPAAFHDPHLRARGFFQTLTGPETGTHEYPVQFFHASRTPQTARRPPVRLGEDNEYVYRDLLGFSPDAFRRFEEEGHIGMDYVPEIK